MRIASLCRCFGGRAPSERPDPNAGSHDHASNGLRPETRTSKADSVEKARLVAEDPTHLVATNESRVQAAMRLQTADRTPSLPSSAPPALRFRQTEAVPSSQAFLWELPPYLVEEVPLATRLSLEDLRSMAKRWSNARRHEPAGGKPQARDWSKDNLVELKELYPQAPDDLLHAAASCVDLDDALLVVVECLVKGLKRPPDKRPASKADGFLPTRQMLHTHNAGTELVEPVIKMPPEDVLGFPKHRDPDNMLKGFVACKTGVHSLTAFTVTVPTWCQECGSFAWGVSNQCLRCSFCEMVICRNCKDKKPEPRLIGL
eukprot:TRINITY_DN27285_c1_g1_i1.p1 TRINITY_DN27285_c1_g1~~TRINITY_DN27285_c1_g1_i1.p1  ORF type:complete len:316 (+),score=46.77 TRINITY_DN27285_c1_g1_i1:81-1028(+)